MNILNTIGDPSESKEQIPRELCCPKLSETVIKTVTDTVFIPSNPQPADVLFVFGSSYGDLWHQVVDLHKRKLAPIIYIAGGNYGTSGILSHSIRDTFISLGVPREVMILDEKSQNTLEDAVFGREIFLQQQVPHKRILFACKAPHSGRCLRTLKKVFPESELFCFIYDFIHEGMNITAEKWTDTELSRSIIWGEYQRIKLYSSRGDICE